MSTQKYRLITRSDFDGLVCAVLLNEMNLIDEIKFVHPKDVQDGKIDVSDRDITTNLPYMPGVHLAFDHHLSETLRNTGKRGNHIIDAGAPSAARVVYNHYGAKAAFPRVTDEIMLAVDKADSAQFSREEILNPGGWVLLNYLMDARTGLGRFHDFRISNYALMMDLIKYCRDHDIGQILALPDVQERVKVYVEHAERAKAQIQRCTTVHGNLVVLDLRKEDKENPDKIVVRYVPTPPEVVEAMCKLAGVGKDDVVYDLGCGDGRIVIAAVQKFGAKRGVGVDLNPERVRESKENARAAGLADRVEFRQGDVLDIKDLADASVVMLYMGDDVNLRLRPILQKTLKPGSRIVSHEFLMGDWKPLRTVIATDADFVDYYLHLWKVGEDGGAKKERP